MSYNVKRTYNECLNIVSMHRRNTSFYGVGGTMFGWS